MRLARLFADAVTGTGDDVLLYTGEAGRATITHQGAGNFAIWHHGDSTDLIVNEIGDIQGTYRWPAGTAFVAITASGPWTISVE